MRLAATATAGLALLALASCAPPRGGVPNRFGSSGELIAMSGAEAGADNACFTCHGLDGRGNGAGAPRLAGLDSGYLAHQLQAFADGRRRDPSMRWIAEQLSPSERLLVSGYYARLAGGSGDGARPVPMPKIYGSGDPARNVPACASCHGADARGTGSGIPPLAGQPAGYLEQQLQHWRRGTRRSDADDIMMEIARALRPEEIAAVAAYASSLAPVPSRRAPAEATLRGHRPDPRNGASALPRRGAGS